MVCFIAVGTPQDEDGSADLSMVLQAGADIAKAMPGYRIVVLKSTVPVGTADKMRATMSANTTHPFDVVSNPEFQGRPPSKTSLKPDRVVIGETVTARCR